MAYTEKIKGLVIPAAAAVLDADVLTATGDHGEYLLTDGGNCRRIKFIIGTLVATDLIEAVVTFTRRPTPGSATGEVVMGTLTIPDGSAVGKIIYADIDVDFDPGDAIEVSVSTAGTDGSSAAGGGNYDFDLNHCPENALNAADMVLSA